MFLVDKKHVYHLDLLIALSTIFVSVTGIFIYFCLIEGMTGRTIFFLILFIAFLIGTFYHLINYLYDNHIRKCGNKLIGKIKRVEYILGRRGIVEVTYQYEIKSTSYFCKVNVGNFRWCVFNKNDRIYLISNDKKAVLDFKYYFNENKKSREKYLNFKKKKKEEKHNDISLKKEYFELRHELLKVGVKIGLKPYLYHETFLKHGDKVIPYVIEAIKKSNNQWFIDECICSLGVKGFDKALDFLMFYHDELYKGDCHNKSIKTIGEAICRINDIRVLEWCYEKMNDDKVVYEDVPLFEFICRKDKNIDRLVDFLKTMITKNVELASNYYGNPLEECKYYMSEYALKNLMKYDFSDKDKYLNLLSIDFFNDFIVFKESKYKKGLIKSTKNRYMKILNIKEKSES